MPAPAVYILAVLGTVGAAYAFKEFVYEPHIAPHIDRWKFEYMAARRRREEGENRVVEAEVAMVMVGGRASRGFTTRGDRKSRVKLSDDESSDGDEGSASGTGTEARMKGGLLLRHSLQKQSTGPSNLGGVKPGSVHHLDESLHPIPFIPLSPTRSPATHVLYDSSSPTMSTPLTGNSSRMTSPPLPPSPPLVGILQTEAPPFPEESVIWATQLPRSPSPFPFISSPAPPSLTSLSPPPQTSPFQHMITQSVLLGNTAAQSDVKQNNESLTPSSKSTSPTEPLQAPWPRGHLLQDQQSPQTHEPQAQSPSQAIPNVSPTHPPLRPPIHPHPHLIPSLSQMYPQELDYEHGLELISPPSSRSDSPFEMTMGGISPSLPHVGGISGISTPSLSAFGSPEMGTGMGTRLGLGFLGNESFDTLSPVVRPAAVLGRSPLIGEAEGSIMQRTRSSSSSGSELHIPISPAHQSQSQSQSVTNSARSTAYLSFADDSESGSEFASNVSSPGPASVNQLASGSASVLGLFPTPMRSPRTPSSTSPPYTNPNSSSSPQQPYLRVPGAGDPSYFRPSAAGSATGGPAPGTRAGMGMGMGAGMSDVDTGSELSDLDFLTMSDYAASDHEDERVEGGNMLGNPAGVDGNESDASSSGWSFAGGSPGENRGQGGSGQVWR
ncbi:hypothetical protein B0H34DRAFT_256111 [Crassisporium funariophilum]|nr:hypothetical protein B0H34DRAFT_256111 [Crassisporium funariophilum]